MTALARQQLAAALRSAKKGRGRFPVAPAAERTVNGIVLDSKREAVRYAELLLLERAGEITHLERQTQFKVPINNVHFTTYSADFTYFRAGERVVEDAKSADGRGTARDPAYRLRKKAAELFFGIRVVEV